MKTKDIELINREYQDFTAKAERLRGAISEQLLALLSENSITLGVPIESRLKTWQSIVEKIDRKQIFLDSITDLPDLIGVRVILLFRSDVEKAVKLIENSFDVISREDTLSRLGDSEFGYQSQHYIVRLPEPWLSLPTLYGLGGLMVELQIRTLAQHIWAAASHKLQYKQETGVPRPLRRTINRVSALLEIVDLEFERVLDERKIYMADETNHDHSMELNVDSMAAVLTDVYPPENRVDNESYADLLSDCMELNVNSPDKLREILLKHLEATLAVDAEKAERAAEDPHTYKFIGPDRIAKGVYFAHVGLARNALRLEFGEKRMTQIFEKRTKNIISS